jgi:hypothetical protein
VTFGGNQQIGYQFGRKLAQLLAVEKCSFAAFGFGGNHGFAGSAMKTSDVANCQNRYPSPNRSACVSGGPVSFSRVQKVGYSGRNRVVIAYQPNKGVDVGGQNSESDATFNSHKGKQLCLKFQLFSRRFHSLVLQHVPVSTQMASVRLLAQVSAVRLAKCLAVAAAASKARWLVLSLVRCSTTLLVANTSQQSLVKFLRRRGSAPAALCV